MDQKEFEALMAKKKKAQQSIGQRVVASANDNEMGLVEEGLRGIGRGTVKSAAALGPGMIDMLYNIGQTGGEKLHRVTTKAMGMEPDEERLAEMRTPSKYSPLGVSRALLKKSDEITDSTFLKGSGAVEKGWREGVKDPGWWTGHISEMAPATLSIMGIAKKTIEKQGKKHLATLASNTASEAAKKKAKVEIGKLSVKAAIKPSIALEGAMQHDEYRKWAIKNPDDANVMHDVMATMFGAASGVLEGAGIGGMMMFPFIKKFGKEAGPKVAGEFWKEFAKAAPKNILVEGGTEGAQQFIQNIGKKIGYAPDTEMSEGIMESLILGGAVGGAFSTFEAGQARSPKDRTEVDIMGVLKAQKKLNTIKGDVAKYQAILDKAKPGSKEYDRATENLNKAVAEIDKQENIISQISKRLKPIEDDKAPLPTDEEAFGTTIDPTLTIDEIAEGIDKNEISPADWEKAPKDRYTEEEIQIVNEHIEDLKNQQDIDALAKGEEIVLEPESNVVDGTGTTSIWSELPEDFTDQDAVDAFQKDLITFDGENAAEVTLSDKPISEPVQRLADLLGVRVISTSIKAKEGGINPNGMVHPNNPNLIYIKDTASKPESWLLGHEFSHSLEKNNPEAYAVLMEAAIPMFDKNSFDAYQKMVSKRMGREVSRKQVAKEMLGDFVGDKFNDKKFWDNVYSENPSKFKEIINSLRDFIGKITAKFTGVTPESDAFFNDIISLEKTLVDVLNEHVGYTGAIEAVTQSKVPTGEIVDLNKGNQHLTHIPIGENAQILMREDKGTIYLKRLARAGARTVQAMTNTLTSEGKGNPTAALNEIKKYAKSTGKRIVAKTEGNQYLIKQGFKQEGGNMVWEPTGKEAVGEAAGAAPAAPAAPAEGTGASVDKKAKEKAARIARDLEDKELYEARKELRDLDKKIQNEIDVAKVGNKEQILFAKEQHDKLVARKKELETRVTEIETKRKADDQKTGEQISRDRQVRKEEVGDTLDTTKGKKTDRRDRDKQGKEKETGKSIAKAVSGSIGSTITFKGKQKGFGPVPDTFLFNITTNDKEATFSVQELTNEAVKKVAAAKQKDFKKPKTLKDKIGKVKQEAEYKSIGGITAELKRITDSLNKSGRQGDPIAFANAVIDAGIEINTNNEEVAYATAFRIHMMGEENVGTAAKKKPKKKERRAKYSKKEQIKLNVLTAKLMGGEHVRPEQTMSEEIIREDIKKETEQRISDIDEEDLFNLELSDEPEELQFSVGRKIKANEAFVAPLEQKIKGLKLSTKLPKKLPAENWVQIFTNLSRKGKINPEEFEFTYLPEWLAEQKGDVSREEVLTYLKEHAPKVTSINKKVVIGTAESKVRNILFNGFENNDPKPLMGLVAKTIKKLQGRRGSALWEIRNKNHIKVATDLLKPILEDQALTAEQKVNEFKNTDIGALIHRQLVLENKTEEEYSAEEQQQIRNIRAEAYQNAKDNGADNLEAEDIATRAVETWYEDEHGEYYEPPDYTYDNMVLDGGLGEYDETLIQYSPKEDKYKGTGQVHWNKPNVLSHLRYDDHIVQGDPTGKKALMIYENQSDWQADISKKGKQETLPADDALNKLIPSIRKDIKKFTPQIKDRLEYVDSDIWSDVIIEVLKDKIARRSNSMFKERTYNTYHDYIVSEPIKRLITKGYKEPRGTSKYSMYPETIDLFTDRDFARLAREIVNKAGSVSTTLKHFDNRFKRAVEEFRNQNRFAAYREDAGRLPFNITLGYPKAPFKKTWPLLGFKHAMIEAYNRGDDYIAWPSTGDQIAQIEGWGDRQFESIIDNVTKTTPRQIGEFVKRYGGKVEKIKIWGDHEVFAVKITPEMETLIENKEIPQFSLDEPLDPKDPNPKVQEQIEKHMEQDTRGKKEKIRNWATALWKSFTSPIPQIRPGKFGYFKDRVRLAKEVDKFGAQQAYFRIYNIIGKLSEDERQVFTMNLVLNDMLNDTVPNESGVSLLRDGHLPFGYKTVDQVRASLRHFREQAKKSPRVMNALARRRKSMLKIQGELIDAGFISEELRGNDSYFHHETIRRMEEGDSYLFNTGGGIGNQDLKMSLDRGSDISAYSLNYITSEFAMISDAVATLELNKLKKQIKAVYDIKSRLLKKAKGGNVAIPKGYEKVFVSQFVGWGAIPKFPDALSKGILEKAKIDPKILEKIQIASGTKESWIIPKDIADAMRTVRDTPTNKIPGRVSEAVVQAWKKWTLINPFRIFKYNVNNMSGDVDIALAYDWRIMQYMPQAMKDIAGDIDNMGMKLPFNMQRYGSYLTSETKAEMKEAHRLGVIGAGFVMHEVTDISKEFEALMRGPQGSHLSKFGQKWWQGSKDITNYRENLLRLAAYRYFKDRIKTGEKHIYGASNPQEIDEISNINEKAAKLSRELIGDYGRLSEGGEWARKHVIPFYSWMEINAPRYVRMMRNLPHEGKSKKGAVASSLAWKGSVLGAKFMMFTAMVFAWNNMMFGDDEKELKGYRKRQMHLLLGRRQDGSIRYLPISGAFRDALSWFGGEDAYYDVTDVMSGKTTIAEQLKENGMAPAWKFYHGSRPIFRSIGEAASGFTMFPSNKPRPIRDKMDYVAKTFSMELAYRFASGKPTRGLAKEFQDKLIQNVDPGELAYREIRDKVIAYNKTIGKQPFKSQPTNKSNALYWYKKGIAYGDLAAAEKYWKIYLEMGGSLKGLKSSIRLTRPTGGLRKKDKRGFYKTLTKEDKILLNTASKWYRQTYSSLPKKR